MPLGLAEEEAALHLDFSQIDDSLSAESSIYPSLKKSPVSTTIPSQKPLSNAKPTLSGLFRNASTIHEYLTPTR